MGRLGTILKDLRLRKGLSAKELAASTGISASRISRVENGRLLPTDGELEAILQKVGADASAREKVFQAAADERTVPARARTDFWRRVEDLQQRWVELEESVTEVRSFRRSSISPLLQVEDYARRFLLESDVLSAGDLELAVDRQMARRAILLDSARSFRFLMTREALDVGRSIATGTMVSQVERLRELAARENVSLRLVDASALRAFPKDDFQIVDARVVVVEALVGEFTVDDPALVAAYNRFFDRAWEDAMSPWETSEALDEAKGRLELRRQDELSRARAQLAPRSAKDRLAFPLHG